MKNILFIWALSLPVFLTAQQIPAIIPHPLSMELRSGRFLIDEHVTIRTLSTDKAVLNVIVFFKNYIKDITGVALSDKATKGRTIEFK
jgi:hexosaminidase